MARLAPGRVARVGVISDLLAAWWLAWLVAVGILALVVAAIVLTRRD